MGLFSLVCMAPLLLGCSFSQPLHDTTSAQGISQPNAMAIPLPMTSEQEAQNAALAESFRAELAEYEEQLVPYKQTVPLGKTSSLANLDDAPIVITTPAGKPIETSVSRFVSWVGTLNATVLDTTLCDSLEEAQKTSDLGTVINPTPPKHIADPRLLVMHVKVTNVDAIPGYTAEEPEEYFPIGTFKPYQPHADGAAGSFMDYTGGTLATFDGAPEGIEPQSPYANDFALPIGETRTLTASWWVDGAVDPSLIVVRPSLSASEPGPITFELELDGVASD